jgi:hypothetical protein
MLVAVGFFGLEIQDGLSRWLRAYQTVQAVVFQVGQPLFDIFCLKKRKRIFRGITV